jgi:hypothetical protein
MKDTELIEFALGVIDPWEVDVVNLDYDSASPSGAAL